jgi:hypothetical protein
MVAAFRPERHSQDRRVFGIAATIATFGRYRANKRVARMEVEMTTKRTIALEDDLDGGPADQTVHFGLGAIEYEIDLNTQNARLFRTQMAPFLEHARKASRGQRRPARSASRPNGAGIRAWAREHGLQVSDRGRIPASVIQRYEAAADR